MLQRSTPNTNHSHQHEILLDCARAFDQFQLAGRVFPSVEARSVGRCSNGHQDWQVGCVVDGGCAQLLCQWTVLCTNRRLGRPREMGRACVGASAYG